MITSKFTGRTIFTNEQKMNSMNFLSKVHNFDGLKNNLYKDLKRSIWKL